MSDDQFMVSYTRWPSMYEIDAFESATETWEKFTDTFSVHRRVRRKDLSFGFGPYHLVEPRGVCIKHRDGKPRHLPHRCDRCVREISMLVFDADETVPEESFHHTDSLLEQDGVARLWYSSYSYQPNKPTFRLVIPISRPVFVEHYHLLRLKALSRYEIPADARKCSGKSHYYHAPSCPPWASPVVSVGAGQPADVQKLGVHAPTPFRKKAPIPVFETFEWQPPEEPTEPVDLGPLLEVLRNRINKLKRSEGGHTKAHYVERCLAGEPIAEKGSRNQAAFILAGIIAYAVPSETSIGTMLHIMRPSVEAMIRAGSKLTLEKVERMLLTASRNKAYSDAAENAEAARELANLAALKERLIAERDAFKSGKTVRIYRQATQ